VASIKKNIEWILVSFVRTARGFCGAQTIYHTLCSPPPKQRERENTNYDGKLLKPSLLIGFKHYFDRV
jgi:hypothetical protein